MYHKVDQWTIGDFYEKSDMRVAKEAYPEVIGARYARRGPVVMA